MKKILILLITGLSAGSALAADFVDTAKVTSVKAVFERVPDPKQECWMETVSSTGTITRSAPAEEHSIGGALLGGLIGGVVGSRVGQGNGNTAATGAGAIAGAIIGDRMSNQNDQQQTQTIQVPQVREEKHCRQIENYRDVIRGYDVTYHYNGRDITTRMSYQPGEIVRVGVSVLTDLNQSDVKVYENRDRR
jgi:uncharacterized protein YcfJ